MKENTRYEVCEKNPPSSNLSVKKDEIIRLTGKNVEDKCPFYLRRVVWFDEDRNEYFEFITNHMRLAASTIGDIYKDRWQIEIFFKMLKQNLKVKTFVGTTANALKIQIWTALISMLILKYLQMKSTFNWSLSNLVALLRMNLFTYRDLWAWLNEPLGTPSLGQIQQQLELNFS